MRWFLGYITVCITLVGAAAGALALAEGTGGVAALAATLGTNGLVALGLGMALTAGLAIGLMALVFHSNRSGHDDDADGRGPS